MEIKKWRVYVAKLDPRMGTEPGKIRPVVVVQTDLLNGAHPSTIICPLTTHLVKEARLLRIHLPKKESHLERDSDILVDQIRAIDNRRIQKQVGRLSANHQQKFLESLH